MVSIGPNSQSYNFTHMFDIPDLRGQPITREYCPYSLMDIVSKNPDFTRYKEAVKSGRLEGILNDSQSSLTLFVPSDRSLHVVNNLSFSTLDISSARHFVKGSILKNKIPSEILLDSQASYFMTLDPPNRLLVTNVNGNIRINDCVNVVKYDIQATNGIIHVVDALIWPFLV